MAHTGDGKSSFLRQCAEGAAKSGAGVIWFVAEDPQDATAERQFAADTGIKTTRIGRNELDSQELDNIRIAAETAEGWAKRILPIFEATDVETVFEVIDKIASVNGYPVREVIVDYAQVLGNTKSLEDDIARLGKGLHARSRKRKFASLVGSQVATDVLKRGREAWFAKRDILPTRPSLGDTEWARRLEKLSKAVWSLFRPNRWKREYGEDCPDDIAELHVIKANFGPMGWVQLGWNGPECRFVNMNG